MSTSSAGNTEDIVDDDEILVMNFWDDGEFPAPTQVKLEEYSDNDSNLEQINRSYDENYVKLEEYSVSVADIKENILVNNDLVHPAPEEEYILGADVTADIFAIARSNEVENDDSDGPQNQPSSDVIILDSDSDDDGNPGNNRHVILQNHMSDKDSSDKTFDDNDLHEENSATDKVNNISSIIITNVESVIEPSENISTHKIKETEVGANLKISELNSVVENEESQGNLGCKNQGEVKHVFKCEICPFTTKTRFSLSRHVLLHTNTDTEITKSAAISAKSNHAKNSGSSQNICCKYCSHKSTTLGNLKSHLLLHTKYNMPIYNCKVCDYKSTKYSLTRHTNRVHKSNKIKYAADANTKIKNKLETTTGNEPLELPSENSSQPKHLEKPKSNTFKCKFCSFTSKIRFALNRHILIHTNIRKKSEGSSDNKNQLKSQISGGSKCKYCSFQAKNNSGLTNHVRLLHKITNIKLECLSCHKIVKKQNMQEHKRTCVKLKRPASKEIKVVKEKSEKINSMSSKEVKNTDKTDSTSVKDVKTVLRNPLKDKSNYSKKAVQGHRFQCMYCSHISRHSRSFELHLNLHTKYNRPIFNCEKCDFRATKKVLTLHMKRVHKTNTLNSVNKKEKRIQKNIPVSEQTKLSESNRKQKYETRHSSLTTKNISDGEPSKPLSIKNDETRRQSLTTRNVSGGEPSKPSSIKNDVSVFAGNFNNFGKLIDLKGSNHELLDQKINVSLDSSCILYVCEICDFVTNQKETLIIHKATHSISDLTSDENKIKSEKLEETKKLINEVKAKGETNIPEKQNTQVTSNKSKRKCIILKNKNRKCSACEGVFVNSPGFVNHKCENVYMFNRLVKCGASKYICKVCQFTTWSRKSIRVHLLTYHKYFEAAAINDVKTECETNTSKKKNSKLTSNKSERKYILLKNNHRRCSACKGVFVNPGAFAVHKCENVYKFNRLVKCDALLGYICKVCQFTTSVKINMRAHLVIHKDFEEAATNDVKIKCDINNSEKKNTELASNKSKRKCILLKNNHRKCSACKRVFVNFSGFVIHKCEIEYEFNRLVKCDDELGYICKVCEFTTFTRNRIQAHLLVHKNLKEATTTDVKTKCETNTSEKKNTELTSNKSKRKCILLEDNHRKCSACKRVFVNLTGFVVHKCEIEHEFNRLVKYDDELGYICKVCEFTAFTRNLIRRHLLVHKNSKYRAGIVNHMSAAHPDTQNNSEKFKYNCDICNFKTNDHRLIRSHKIRCHKEPLTCGICGYKTIFSNVMTNHMKFTHKLGKNKDNKTDESGNENKYKCDSCDFETNYKHNLQNHKILHININEVRVYKNKTYNFRIKKYNTKKSSIYAESSDSDSSEQETTKSNCDTSTNLKENCSSSPRNLFSCYLCSFTTNNKDSLSIHCSNHRNVQTEQILKCNVCTYSTRIKKYLIMHKKIHDTRKIYHCNYCDYYSHVKADLWKHYDYSHPLGKRRLGGSSDKSNNISATTIPNTSELPPQSTKSTILFSCKYCKYKSNIRFKLKKHVERSHSKSKKSKGFLMKDKSNKSIYRCDFCPFVSKYKQSLESHVESCKYNKNIAKDLTPVFKCISCFYTTKYKHALNKHFNICHIEK